MNVPIKYCTKSSYGEQGMQIVLIEVAWRIYASTNYAIIGSNNDSLLVRRSAIIWTNPSLYLTGPMGANVSEKWTKIQRSSCKKFENAVRKLPNIVSRYQFLKKWQHAGDIHVCRHTSPATVALIFPVGILSVTRCDVTLINIYGWNIVNEFAENIITTDIFSC